MARVLVVDDAELMRVALGDMLESGGHEVAAAAENADDAVSRFRETRPDLVVLDYIIPGSPCAQTIRAIREVDPAVRILVITALKAKVLGDDAIAGFGARACLRKPFTRATFLDAVKNALA